MFIELAHHTEGTGVSLIAHINKNAFQWDAYRPLVARISRHDRPLVARISRHVLVLGGVPAQVPPMDRHMPVNILPCPKLLLWAVTMTFSVWMDTKSQQECIPVGCILPACYHTGGGVSVQGVSLTETPLPPVNRMTDRCKNITWPQLRCGR